MEYQVGSLADLISGSSSVKDSNKLIENAGTIVKYEKVSSLSTKKNVERKRKRNDVDSPKLKRLRFSEPLETYRYPSVDIDESKEVNYVERKGERNNVDSPKLKRLRFIEPLETYRYPSVDIGESNEVKYVKNKVGKKKEANYVKNKVRKKEDLNTKQHILDPEEELRTIFVGNLPKTTKSSFLKGMFVQYGNVETVRFRSASVADPQTSKKVAVIKGQLHPNRTNINGYVRFETAKSAHKALAANGMVLGDHTLRVDLAGNTDVEPKKCVFIGNLKFTVEEEDLRKMFESCGKILNVRIVRDRITGMGKGIAFINFATSGSVELALNLHEEELMGRPLRVSRLKNQGKKERKRASLNQNSLNGERVKENAANAKRRKEKKKKTGAQQNTPVVTQFQGEKTDVKKPNKKKKQNKGELKKKIMLSRLEITPKLQKKKIPKQN